LSRRLADDGLLWHSECSWDSIVRHIECVLVVHHQCSSCWVDVRLWRVLLRRDGEDVDRRCLDRRIVSGRCSASKVGRWSEASYRLVHGLTERDHRCIDSGFHNTHLDIVHSGRSAVDDIDILFVILVHDDILVVILLRRVDHLDVDCTKILPRFDDVNAILLGLVIHLNLDDLGSRHVVHVRRELRLRRCDEEVIGIWDIGRFLSGYNIWGTVESLCVGIGGSDKIGCDRLELMGKNV